MTVETPKALHRLGPTPERLTQGEGVGRSGHTFIAMWPLDPDVGWKTATNEARRRLRPMLAQAAVELLGEGTFTTRAATADEGFLPGTLLVFTCPARELPSCLDPFLPSDVVIRENGYSLEKHARVEALLQQGWDCRRIADYSGISIRKVERIKASVGSVA